MMASVKRRWLSASAARRAAVVADDERAQRAPLEAERRGELDRVRLVLQEELLRVLDALRDRRRGGEPRAQALDVDERGVLLGAPLAVEDADGQALALRVARLPARVADEDGGGERGVRA